MKKHRFFLFLILASLLNPAMALNDGAGNEFFSSNVGIYTMPSSTLDVNGTITTNGFKLTTAASDGKVLTSDANGHASWETASASSASFGTKSTGLTLGSSSYKALSDGFVQAFGMNCSGGEEGYTDGNKTPSTVGATLWSIFPGPNPEEHLCMNTSVLMLVKENEYVRFTSNNYSYTWIPIGSSENLQLRASNNLSCSSGGGNYDAITASSTTTIDWTQCEEIQINDSTTGTLTRTINFTDPPRDGFLLLRLFRSTAASSVTYNWEADITWVGIKGIPGDSSGATTEINGAGTYIFNCEYDGTPAVGVDKYQCTWQ